MSNAYNVQIFLSELLANVSRIYLLNIFNFNVYLFYFAKCWINIVLNNDQILFNQISKYLWFMDVQGS